MGRHRTFEWCRIQLSYLLIPSRHKTSEIPVSNGMYSVAQLVAALPYNPEGRLIDSRWRRLGLKSFRPQYGSGVNSASNRKKYQEYPLECKGGWCIRLTTVTTFICRLSRRFGSVNILQPLCLVQSCNWISCCL